MRGINTDEFAKLTGQQIDQFLPETFNFREDELEIRIEEATLDQLLEREAYEDRTGKDCGYEFTIYRYFAIIDVNGVSEVCEAEDDKPLGEVWGGDLIGLDSIKFVIEYHRDFADWPKRDIESERTLTVYIVKHDESERLTALRELCVSAMAEADYNQVLRAATILRVSLPRTTVIKRRRY